MRALGGDALERERGAFPALSPSWFVAVFFFVASDVLISAPARLSFFPPFSPQDLGGHARPWRSHAPKRESAARSAPSLLPGLLLFFFCCLGCADLGAGAPFLPPSPLLAAGSRRTCAPLAVAHTEERERGAFPALSPLGLLLFFFLLPRMC
jgi:hypothetical protein